MAVLSAGHTFQRPAGDGTAHELDAGVTYAADLLGHSLTLYASLPGCFGAGVRLAAGMSLSHMLPPWAATSNASAVDLASKSLRTPAASRRL